MMKLVLASGSPRRREILTTLGLTFEVRPTGVDETPRGGESAVALAARIARAKCEAAIAAGHEAPLPLPSGEGRGEGPSPQPPTPDHAFLAADTVVDIDGAPLNKPDDDAHAARMLRSLSGRSHRVHTACALGVRGAVHAILVSTDVEFRVLDPGTIDRYVASGEGRDKAGAYAVQGLGAGLVTAVRGSPSNVIGLPAAETIDLLVAHGVIARWP
jgi:septum formation protein